MSKFSNSSKEGKTRDKVTNLVLRLLEGTVDIIFWLPYPWNALLVVTEPFFEVIS